jgi:hypothetical protein
LVELVELAELLAQALASSYLSETTKPKTN